MRINEMSTTEIDSLLEEIGSQESYLDENPMSMDDFLDLMAKKYLDPVMVK
jgi:hypothetical protein